jgi:hypothetical protein
MTDVRDRNGTNDQVARSQARARRAQPEDAIERAAATVAGSTDRSNATLE